MANTIREQIITAVEAKLAHILTSKGYQTECGANVQRARKSLDQAELPAVVVIPKPEEGVREYANSVLKMRMRVEALKQFNPETENPSEVSEQMLGDLIECVAGNRWSMAFDTGTYEPQPGDTITGATSGATATVESVTRSSGTWAGGDSAGTIYFRRLVGRFTHTAAVISPPSPEVNENINIAGHSAAIKTNGTATYISPETSTCAGLADDIRYVGGGTNEYPEAPDTTVGVVADFEITYSTVAGNPYARPA